MARVKRGVTSHAKHKKVLEQAKGFRGRRKNTIRTAKAAVAYGLPIIAFLSIFLLRPMKGLLFAYQYHHKAEEARFPPGRD